MVVLSSDYVGANNLIANNLQGLRKKVGGNAMTYSIA